MNRIYIDEAIRIRERYIQAIEDIQAKEQKVMGYKKSIEDIIEYGTKMIKSKTKTEDELKMELGNKVMEIEDNIKMVQKELQPQLDEIEILKKESKKLYNTITEKYPELTEIQIQEEIIKNIKR